MASRMISHKAAITRRSVDALDAPPKGGEARLYDDKLAGFFVRVRPSGERYYCLFYRLAGKQRVMTIGKHDSPWKPETARERAKAALERVAAGHDPLDEKHEARAALTVAQLIDVYLENGPATKPGKRASSWDIDASNLRRHIEPLLGGKIAAHLKKADAAKAIADIAAGKTKSDAPEKSEKKRGRVIVTGGYGVSRRCRTVAVAMFNWGLSNDYIKGANPFASVKLTTAPTRERFLSDAEADQLVTAIGDLEAEGELSPVFGDAIRLLMLTGARKTEILGLRWSEVDFAAAQLVLPPARTKAGGHTGERRVQLSPPAQSILSERQSAAEKAALEAARKAGEEQAPPTYVFPGYRGDGHATGLRKAFLEVTKRAKLPGLRIHDLRHSFASALVADGATLHLVAKLLGHANTRVTERYAHLSNDPLHAAVAKVGRRYARKEDEAEAEEATKADNVVQLPGRGR